MMEENNDIFFAGGDALLLYLAEPMHKKYSTTFALGHSLSTYAPVHILDDSPPFLQLFTYLMDGLLFNQKTNRRSSEFSNYEIELRNRVTQNDVTL